MKILNGSRRAPECKHLEKLEKLVGCKMPKDYQEFLSDNNGGCPRRSIFKKKDVRFYMQCFWPLTEDVTPNIRQETEDYFDELPQYHVRIGITSGVALLLDAKNGGLLQDGVKMLRVARDIKEFIDHLGGEEEPEESLLSRMVSSGDIDSLHGYLDAGNSIEDATEGRSIVEQAAVGRDMRFVKECVKLGANTSRLRKILERIAMYSFVEALENEGIIAKPKNTR